MAGVSNLAVRIFDATAVTHCRRCQRPTVVDAIDGVNFRCRVCLGVTTVLSMTPQKPAAPAYWARWDVARDRKRCSTRGCLIGQGEAFRKVSTADLPVCVRCAAQRYPGETPPASMPVSELPAVSKMRDRALAVGAEVVDVRAIEICKRAGCVGDGERCKRCHRKLAAAVRLDNASAATLSREIESVRQAAIREAVAAGRDAALECERDPECPLPAGHTGACFPINPETVATLERCSTVAGGRR